VEARRRADGVSQDDTLVGVGLQGGPLPECDKQPQDLGAPSAAFSSSRRATAERAHCDLSVAGRSPPAGVRSLLPLFHVRSGSPLKELGYR